MNRVSSASVVSVSVGAVVSSDVFRVDIVGCVGWSEGGTRPAAVTRVVPALSLHHRSSLSLINVNDRIRPGVGDRTKGAVTGPRRRPASGLRSVSRLDPEHIYYKFDRENKLPTNRAPRATTVNGTRPPIRMNPRGRDPRTPGFRSRSAAIRQQWHRKTTSTTNDDSG